MATHPETGAFLNQKHFTLAHSAAAVYMTIPQVEEASENWIHHNCPHYSMDNVDNYGVFSFQTRLPPVDNTRLAGFIFTKVLWRLLREITLRVCTLYVRNCMLLRMHLSYLLYAAMVTFLVRILMHITENIGNNSALHITNIIHMHTHMHKDTSHGNSAIDR